MQGHEEDEEVLRVESLHAVREKVMHIKRRGSIDSIETPQDVAQAFRVGAINKSEADRIIEAMNKIRAEEVFFDILKTGAFIIVPLLIGRSILKA